MPTLFFANISHQEASTDKAECKSRATPFCAAWSGHRMGSDFWRTYFRAVMGRYLCECGSTLMHTVADSGVLAGKPVIEGALVSASALVEAVAARASIAQVAGDN